LDSATQGAVAISLKIAKNARTILDTSMC